MSAGARATGQHAEMLAQQFMEQRGMQTVALNYQCPCGEIDAVMRDGDVLVFVEVRYRRSDRFGTPAETIRRKKQERLLKSARHYLQSNHRTREPRCRFDVIVMTGNLSKPNIQWIRDAIQA
jgi:putative endonuclease